MAQKQLTLPGAVVKKHNVLVRSPLDIKSPQAARILTSLIACINKDDTDFKEVYHVPVKDILSSTGGGDYRQIKAVCSDLRKAGVDLEWLDDAGEYIFLSLGFFSDDGVSYRKGVISAKFSSNEKIRQCLIDLQGIFTQYNLIEYLKLPSLYSQRIFEILMSWKRTNTEKTYPLHELHYMLKTPESFRKDFRNFRLRVLDKAYKDINGKTDLAFEWEAVKKGRAVEAIRFIFGHKKMAVRQKESSAIAQEKQSAENNALVRAAVECSRAKGGQCQN